MAALYTLRQRALGSGMSTFGSTPVGMLRRAYSAASPRAGGSSHVTASTVPILRRGAARSSSSSLLFPTAAGLTAGAALASCMHLSSWTLSNPGMAAARCDAAAGGSGAARPIHSRAGTGTGSSVINKRTAKQMSTGSLLGLSAGLAISIFSKPLTVLLGLFIASTQLFQMATGARIPFLEQAEVRLARLLGRKVKDAGDVFDADKWRQNLVFRLSFGLACLLAGGFLDL